MTLLNWSGTMGLADIEIEEEKRRKLLEEKKRLVSVEAEAKRWEENEKQKELVKPKKNFKQQLWSNIKDGYDYLKTLDMPNTSIMGLLAPSVYPGAKIAEYIKTPIKLKDDVNSLVEIARSFPRAFASAGMTISQLGGKGETEYQPTGKFEETLLGKEKIKDVQGRGEDAMRYLGVDPGISKKWGFGVGLALTALDLSLVGGGGAKSKILKEFAASKEVGEAMNIAKKYGMNLKMSELEALTSAKTPHEVQNIIGGMLDKITGVKAGMEEKGIKPPVQGETPLKTQPSDTDRVLKLVQDYKNQEGYPMAQSAILNNIERETKILEEKGVKDIRKIISHFTFKEGLPKLKTQPSALKQEAKTVKPEVAESTVPKPGHFLPPTTEKQLADIREIPGTPPKQTLENVNKVSSYEKPTPELPVSQPKNMSSVRKMIVSGEKILQRSGEGGKELAETMKTQREKEDLLRGSFVYNIKQAFKGLSKKERINVGKALEGQSAPQSAQEATALKSMQDWLAGVADTAQKEGFEISVPSAEGIKKVPFSARENYFPHIHDFDKLRKGKQRVSTIEHLVTSGQARNQAEAEKLLDNYIMANAERRAGNIEHARTLDMPGYEQDPLVALQQYATSVAKRFTEAFYFGKRDEKVADLIKTIGDQGGDYKEAQRIFDFTVGGMPKSPVVSALTKFNALTKLSLSFIINATQNINTATKGGVVRTTKEMLNNLSDRSKAIGELAGVYQDFVIKKESGMKVDTTLKAVMKPFSMIENFNRRVAGNVGYGKAQQLEQVYRGVKDEKGMIAELRKNYAIRQLESLGIGAEKLLKGKLTQDDLLLAANKMAERTQFKIDPLDVPPSWKTPVGRLLTQFKSFNYMQTKFVRDEIIKEATKGNLLPLMRFVVIAPLASYLAYKVKNKLTGVSETDPNKGALDLRDWDKWAKAIGTIPTDLISQGQFLGKTLTTDYLTPLQKGARVAGSVAGPTAGEIGNLIAGLESIPRREEAGKADPYLLLERQGIEKAPFVGQRLKNTYFGYLPKWEDATSYEKYQLMQKMDSGESKQKLKELKKTRPSQVQSIVKYQKWDKLGVTDDEKDFSYMGVENGERPNAIFNYLKDMTDEEATVATKRMRKAGILTDDVLIQVKRLIKANKLNQ